MLLNDNQQRQVQRKMWTYLVLQALCFPTGLKIKIYENMLIITESVKTTSI